MAKYTIAIADDHPIYRNGLQNHIEQGKKCKVVISVSNGKELLKALEKKQVDAVLLDMRMPEMDGVETTKQLRKLYPQINVIAISFSESESYIVGFLKMGGSAYLVKGSDTENICEVIQEVMEKGYHLNERVSLASIGQLSKASHLTSRSTLEPAFSVREIEIIRLISKEHTTQEIAKALKLSEHTIKTHRERLLEKTNSRNIAGVVLFAVRMGIVSV